MSGWQDALEAQYDLFRFWRSPLGRRYGESFLADKEDKDPGSGKYLTGNNTIASAEASKMLLADPIYVTDEMFTVAEAACEMFRPEALHESDLLTTNGFVLLPRPFLTPDVHNKITAWRAFAWMPAQTIEGEHSGIHLATYTNRADHELDDYRDMLALVPPDQQADWSMLHAQPWWFGVEAPKNMEGAGWWVNCQVLFRLMMQHIAIREERQAPRATRRRWQREWDKQPEGKERYVVVVKLRRPKSKGDSEERDVQWQHRWLVSGHWRNQWFPSLNRHRQIWISPFIKGPEDKPLVVRKARAFELVR